MQGLTAQIEQLLEEQKAEKRRSKEEALQWHREKVGKQWDRLNDLCTRAHSCGHIWLELFFILISVSFFFPIRAKCSNCSLTGWTSCTPTRPPVSLAAFVNRWKGFGNLWALCITQVPCYTEQHCRSFRWPDKKLAKFKKYWWYHHMSSRKLQRKTKTLRTKDSQLNKKLWWVETICSDTKVTNKTKEPNLLQVDMLKILHYN